MKRPSFQFYPADWQANSNLRRCTHEEKGIWLDVLCLLHDQEEYGIVRWPLKEIAQAINCSLAKLKGLVTKGVLKGADASQTAAPVVFVPRHGRKDGEPVTIIAEQTGPIWYSSRMVVDEYKRVVRGESSPSPKHAPMPPIGEGIGDAPNPTPDSSPSRAGASSSSSTSSTVNTPRGVFTSGQRHDARFSMAAAWLPSPDIVKLTVARGVSQHFVEDSVPEFVLYWRERPATTDYQGGWDSKFLKNTVKQWEKFRAALNTKQPEPLPRDFYPDDQTVADLHIAGVPEDSILGSVNSFVRYYTENAATSLNWNFRFYGWALDDHMRHGQSSTSLEAKLTDRSWAEGAQA